MARSTGRAAQGGEGADTPRRRAGSAAAGIAVGPGRQAVSIRDRRGQRLAGGALPRPLAAPRLSLHVRPRLQGGLRDVLDDRGRVQWICHSSGQPRRHTFSGVAGAAREAAGVQAADGMDLSLGVLAGRRLQLRLQRLVHRAATARWRHRIQLRARRSRDGPDIRPTPRCRAERRHGGNRCGHLHAREAGHERVPARGRCRLPHLFRLCARTGRALGHVPVARPRAQGAQRDRHVVAPPRRVRQGLSQVVAGATGDTMVLERAFFGVSALLFAASAAATIVWCTSMSAMDGMPMPEQTWTGAAGSFLGMWVVMMVAMMLPSLVPTLWRYRQAVRRMGESRLGGLTALLGIAYFSVWTVFGVAAFALGV